MTPPRWTELTAVFGGVFDPPHIGHREAVRSLFKNPGVGRVLVIPSSSPAYKPCQALPEQRLEMAKMNFAARPGDPFPDELDVSPIELDRAKRNPGSKTYTFDTLLELGAETGKIAFVIGADQLANLHTWHRFPDVLELAHWIVLARQPRGVETFLQAIRDWESSGLAKRLPGSPDALHGVWRTRSGQKFLRLTPTDAPALSSTEIRKAISLNGQPPEGALLPEISAYLKQNRLYGSNPIEENNHDR